ncbi:MAG: DUF3365 domain-containing protein [Verrucomicrobia bacterium]|nr:DUF3365 domain-containing protein [Verrucomicrobiota bacterium]
MKKPLILSAAFVLAAAAHRISLAADPAASARFVDPEAPEHKELCNLGERAIDRLVASLAGEAMLAVQKSGAEVALEVCHLKALPLTGQIISDLPRITAVKRTSLRLRNPANAPDASELAALKQVEKSLESGVLPKVLLQQIAQRDGQTEWRVYRPVGIAPPCMACHGPTESLQPELQARLKKFYPADQATGYAAGQWRGLIRVTVADSPPPAPPTGKSSSKTPNK